MATTSECYLCNCDAGGDSLCPECIDKAAGYDDLYLRHELAGVRLRETILGAIVDVIPNDPSGLMQTIADAIREHVMPYFAPELAAFDAKLERRKEFHRQAEAATLHKPTPAEARECAEIAALADSIGASGGTQI